MSTSTHTPTPWFVQITPLVIRIGPSSKGISAWLDKVLISLPATPENKVIAEQVVRACNSHAGLVAALERLLTAFIEARALAIKEPMACTPLVTSIQCAGGAVAEARAALAAAKEQN